MSDSKSKFRLSLKNMAVRYKIGIPIMVLFVLSFAIFLLSYYKSQVNQDENQLIHVLHQAQLESQSLQHSAQLAANGSASEQLKIQQLTQRLNLTINALEEGKPLYLDEDSVRQVRYKLAPKELSSLKASWTRYFVVLDTLSKMPLTITQELRDSSGNTRRITEPNQQLSKFYEQSLLVSTRFMETFKQLVSIIEHKKENNLAILQMVEMALLITLALLLIVSWIIANFYVILPLNKLSKASEAVAEGNLETDIGLLGQDEIGSIAISTQSLADSIRKAREFTESIGQGKYDAQLNGKANSKDSLFQSLIGMRDQLRSVAEEESKRNWVTKGMAEFTEILRSNDTDLKELSNKIITGLVRYLGASQGALFVLNDENPSDTFLEMTACYAYDETKYEARKVIVKENFGEGLVGQAFLENDTIYITNVPEEYLNIASGLGNSNPRSILIVPLELNGSLEGVIELASFNNIEKHQIEFVEKLAENIASAILSIKVNEHTKKLLRESQELTEQLQAKEEEMRQNYEELQATQEEVQRKNNLIEEQKTEIEKALAEQTEKSEMLLAQEEEMRQNMEELVATQEQMTATQAELDGQLNAINNSSISKVEINLEGFVINANNAFCELTDYRLNEIKEKNFSLFLPAEAESALKSEAFWEALKNKEAQTGEYQLQTRNEETIWINAVYSPAVNRKGQVYKIILLAFDITDAKKLLQETQSQAEILQAQEAELRQNMSELKQAQEELNRKSQAIIELKEEEAKNARLKAKEIESKNQLITSSIQYAQNIQSAILPAETSIRQVVQDYFALYLPKDIVSGDFYWFSHVENKSFFAAVDCTGHGVPGAFMSIIGNTLLNEIVNVQHVFDTGKILELLHLGVRNKLKQAESNNNDGMDLVICMLDYRPSGKVKLQFSGAKRPLYYVKNDHLDELKGDRKSIGGWQQEDHRTFGKQEIFLEKGDLIYLTSDGLVDNPNINRKKYGNKRWRNFIEQYYQLPLTEQKNLLSQSVKGHQGEAEQRDDITVLGLRL